MTVDVDKLTAIDVHTHAERNEGEPQDPVTTEVLAAAARYFGGHPPQPTAQEVADYYRERNMLAVMFTSTTRPGWGASGSATTRSSRPRGGNPDVLIPFASVDPHKGKLAVREARELIDAGVRGFKFHPNTQAFWPNDPPSTRSTR
jgi:predicted TIM-barrel fold metal-dependent hydrolase